MSLVESGWRQFTFFEKHNVYDPSNPEHKFNGLKNLRACCSVSGDGFTIFGEPSGAILKLSRNLEEYYWIAHKHSLANIALAGHILATVGEDEEGINSLIKLWQLDRIEKDSPFCVRVIPLGSLLGVGHNTQACAIALHSSLSHIAVGFVDSSVIYCTGNIIKEKSGKWLLVVNGSGTSSNDKITGLCLTWISGQDLCILYCLTSTSVTSYSITKRSVANKVLHDAKGCLCDCWDFSETRNQLIVGSSEMVHFYDVERSLAADSDSGRGRCHALGRNNEKIQLIAFGNHIALLTRQPAVIPSSTELWTYVVSIYDTEGQCVAFSCALPSVSRIFLLDFVLMVLSQDGTISAFMEKSISSKLDILLKKNLYDLAVGVAKRSSVAMEHLPEIYKKYGDYLYRSGDFENAVQQYAETVGCLEPSYVIKKFLDGSRIKELCIYLEVLHSKGNANSHHTTILLNCYTRLADRKKISDFIDRDFDCNMETAVQVLRAANFTAEACRLCAKQKWHIVLLSILIEDRADYQSALKYISKLDISEVEQCLDKFGKYLLMNNPEETMELILDKACFGHINAFALMKVFVGLPSQCRKFMENAVKHLADNVDLRNLLLEFCLRQWALRDEVLQYDKLIEYYMRQNKLKEIIELCEKENSRDLWMNVILFVSREKNLDADMIHLLLERIEAFSNIHPLVVLEIFSKSDKFCVSHVRNYIINWMKQRNTQVETDEKSIAENEAKMANIEEQIDNINYKVQIFQMNKCSACDTSLQLPAIHFLCKHSYHAHCLESYSEKADRCPACTQDTFIERFENDSEKDFSSFSAYAQFRNEINESVDCMALISSYIGNGIFDVWCKEKTLKTENESNISDPNIINKKSNLKQFVDWSASDKDSMSVLPHQSFSASKPVTSLTKSAESTNPFDNDVDASNPFEEDM
ncbi:unnamed protein product [Thelazia callipaeda]|uniref:Vacuolar protein sorting-associated protein 11 homolog n=1 Tax=Thelazia callipaeda TaxID=103827 RepID=A0A0N5CUL6_THECL|nr:unnamed protein product [Thelazia callipaeda]